MPSTRIQKLATAAALVSGFGSNLVLAEDLQISTQYKGRGVRDTLEYNSPVSGRKALKASDTGYRDYVGVTARKGDFFATYTTSAFATGQGDWQKWVGPVAGRIQASTSIDGCGSLPVTSCQNYTAKGKQRDQDLSVGYYVFPQLAGTLSRKQIKNEYDWSSFVQQGNTTCASRANLWSYGVAANAPFGTVPKTYVYANYNKSFSSKNGDNCDGFNAVHYTNFEFGFAYALRENLIATIGYREQDKNWTTANGFNLQETQGGAIGGLSYRF